nr:hypothetical protein [Thermus sediminis]
MALGEGSVPRAEAALLGCLQVLRGLEVLGLYREEGATLVLLGRERPLLLVALERGRPMPHLGPPRGRPLARRPLPFLRELSLARRVVVLPGEYRCFVLHRARVVGVIRLSEDLEPIPLDLPLEALPK